VTAAVVLAGCWRSTRPDPQSTPPPAASAPAKITILRAGPRETDLLDPVLLARSLRTDPRRALSDLGPIVAVDLDQGTLDTLCDEAALRAQEAWHALLTDPDRPAPTCRLSATAMTCDQRGASPLLIVNFTTTVPVHPVTVVHGMPGARAASLSVIKLKTALQNARCP
jgi:hypothetical protein